MKILLLTSIFALTLSSCATATRGRKESIIVTSQPPAADVQLSTGQAGQTPAEFSVPRRGDIAVTVSADGYVAQTHTLKSSISKAGGTAMAGNIILGGLIGAAVDTGTGAMNAHKPNPLHVVLDKE